MQVRIKELLQCALKGYFVNVFLFPVEQDCVAIFLLRKYVKLAYDGDYKSSFLKSEKLAGVAKKQRSGH